ncbi:MAG TPA: hypothetical protein VGM03_17535 [Phycisphaerae bacterium]|jgi:hypothetical protein
MESGKFWSRVGSWFRSAGHLPEKNGEWAHLDSDGALSPFQVVDSPSVGTVPDREVPHGNGHAKPASPLQHWSRRKRNEAAIQRLQEGYIQVAGLIDSLQKHMATQDARSAEISHSLSQLATSLGQLPELSRRQADSLASIGQQMHDSGERTRQIEDTLPQLADSQRQMLTVMSERMDSARALDERMLTSLDGFSGAVTSLGAASSATTSTLQQMEASAQRREEQLSGLVQQQNRRFLMLFAVTTLLAAAAISIGVAALLR